MVSTRMLTFQLIIIGDLGGITTANQLDLVRDVSCTFGLFMMTSPATAGIGEAQFPGVDSLPCPDLKG